MIAEIMSLYVPVVTSYYDEHRVREIFDYFGIGKIDRVDFMDTDRIVNGNKTRCMFIYLLEWYNTDISNDLYETISYETTNVGEKTYHLYVSDVEYWLFRKNIHSDFVSNTKQTIYTEQAATTVSEGWIQIFNRINIPQIAAKMADQEEKIYVMGRQVNSIYNKFCRDSDAASASASACSDSESESYYDTYNIADSDYEEEEEEVDTKNKKNTGWIGNLFHYIERHLVNN